MIRAGLVLLLIGFVAVAVLALTGDAGRASVTWLGWRADMTAATAMLLTLFASLAATIVWRTVLWVLEAPERAERTRAEARRRQANEVLARGFVAAAAGEGSEARRLAQKAADLASEAPGLVRVLAAQAAEADGDRGAAEAAYQAMLGFPEMRLAGRRGLMQLALQQGDREGALRHAEEAFALPRSARWAWRALLDARLAAGDWNGALDLVRRALDRKLVAPIVADRARAALLAASAAQLEHSSDPKAREQALTQATDAAKLQPGFAPGVALAARLLSLEGKLGRAASMLEAAWRAAPHPALFLAYRDLRTNETPRARAQRLAQLASQNPTHRETWILNVERALILGDAVAAQEAVRGLELEPVTDRIAGLMARVAFASGQPDRARVWLARGVSAPREPDWSDLDPEGRAFAYQASDWARLVATYAESGDLIHPRHERRERTLGALPELPISYEDSAALLAAVDPAAAPFPVEEGHFREDEAELVEAVAAPRRRTASRGRLARPPRPAK
jgi:HemY protein